MTDTRQQQTNGNGILLFFTRYFSLVIMDGWMDTVWS